VPDRHPTGPGGGASVAAEHDHEGAEEHRGVANGVRGAGARTRARAKRTLSHHTPSTVTQAPRSPTSARSPCLPCPACHPLPAPPPVPATPCPRLPWAEPVASRGCHSGGWAPRSHRNGPGSRPLPPNTIMPPGAPPSHDAAKESRWDWGQKTRSGMVRNGGRKTVRQCPLPDSTERRRGVVPKHHGGVAREGGRDEATDRSGHLESVLPQTRTARG